MKTSPHQTSKMVRSALHVLASVLFLCLVSISSPSAETPVHSENQTDTRTFKLMVSSAAISCMYQAAGRDDVARARRDLSVRGPRIWWIEKADKQRFIVVFPQALPVDPARPSGASPPNILIQHWTFTANDSVWWTHKIAANYPYLANPENPRIIHPLDAPFLAAVLHDVLKKYRADTRRVYVVGFSSGAEMASDFAQSASTEVAAVAIVGSVGLDRLLQLTHPVSAFLAIGTDDPSTQFTWNAMPAIARDKWYGQQALPERSAP